MFAPDSKWTLLVSALIFVGLVALAGWRLKNARGIWGRIISAVVVLLVPVSGFVTVCFAINHARHFAPTWRSVAALAGVKEEREVQVEEAAIPAYTGHDRPLEAPDGPQWKAQFVRDPENGALKTDFTGPNSGVTMPVWVWVPSDYDPAKTYRVVILLEGYPSLTSDIPKVLDLDGQMPGITSDTIIAIPKLELDSESPDCVDIAGRPQAGSWVTKDVVGLVQANFSTSQNRNDWAIAGASYGGWCAPVLGLSHPQIFGSVISMSGYNPPMTGRLQDDPRAVSSYTITNMMQKASWPQRFYLTGTTGDTDSEVFLQEVSQVNKPNLPVETYLDPRGGHNWKIWHDHFPEALRWWQGEVPDNAVAKKTDIKQDAFFTGPLGPVLCGLSVVLLLGWALARGKNWGILKHTIVMLAIAGLGAWCLLLIVNLDTKTVVSFESIDAFFKLLHR
ncbi:Acetyl esterase [Actinobaculum suis]|uniref:Acetyl esterase n=1 Tax=Actinobaculum suis TaxID=1657 RepID=A0A7Z8Y8A4_9ACTO|nr:alpha/beta hydrolase-fold protein [Actinobaculum suis]VDG76073.1 Acetyl esterase [Actinobaculum suis]